MTLRPIKDQRIVAPSKAIAERAGQLLRAGRLVALPTETVYGLGALAADHDAVAALYRTKGRPPDNPLIIHVTSIEQAQRIGVFNAPAQKLAQTLWPGGLTLILPATAECPVAANARAGLDTVAIRLPDHHFTQEVITSAGGVIAAPSANKSGRPSPTTALHVAADFCDCLEPALIIDGGKTLFGIESTIVACNARSNDWRILRPGVITEQQITEITGVSQLKESPIIPSKIANASKLLAPGNSSSHYAPKARVRLNATIITPHEAVITFGHFKPKGLESALKVINLSAIGDLEEAATNLYGAIRKLDELSPLSIAIASIPNDGIGLAINDRLIRAAAPRTHRQTTAK